MDPALLSATIESAADAIVTVNLQGRIGLNNRKFLTLWDLPEGAAGRGTLAALTSLMASRAKDPALLRQVIEEACRPSSVPLRRMIEMQDGRYCELRAEPLIMEGMTKGTVLSFRQETKDHAPAGDRHFRLLFENMKEAALLQRRVKTGGGADFLIEGANRAFERLSGLGSEEVAGRLASELFSGLLPEAGQGACPVLLAPGKIPVRVSLHPLAEDSFVSFVEEAPSQRAEAFLAESLQRLRGVFESTVQAIAITVETRDPYTAGHQRRSAELASAIAGEMGLSAEQKDCIRTAALIHDIGKISVPAEILSKPTLLSRMEISLIKTHPQAGYDILKDIAFPWPIARVVLEHHERLDGSGYPQGLKGGELLLESRVLSVADVVEAIASNRPYRPAHSLAEAMEEIRQNMGVLYDADVVSSCLKVLEEKRYQPPQNQRLSS